MIKVGQIRVANSTIKSNTDSRKIRRQIDTFCTLRNHPIARTMPWGTRAFPILKETESPVPLFELWAPGSLDSYGSTPPLRRGALVRAVRPFPGRPGLGVRMLRLQKLYPG